METINELAYKSRKLQKAVKAFKAMEYPDNDPYFWNNARAGIYYLARDCKRLAAAIPTKET